MGAYFWGEFDDDGQLLERYKRGEQGLSDQDHRQAGRIPISIPSGRSYTQIQTVVMDSNGGVVFEWPPHLREWREFRRALRSSSLFPVVFSAALQGGPLAFLLGMFNTAIDELVDEGATAFELGALQFQWSLFKPALLEATFAEHSPQEVVGAIEAIAQQFDIQLDLPEE